jgi:Prolyl oligopeptidase, N-terminal beta-propeller domain
LSATRNEAGGPLSPLERGLRHGEDLPLSGETPKAATLIISRFVGALAATMVAASALALTSTYPPAARGDHIDRYHGIAVPDPYRWMEDIDSTASRAWIEAEGKLTECPTLDQSETARDP